MIKVRGEGEIAYALPAFAFDGETHTEIQKNGNCLTVAYEGWLCRYTVSGTLTDTEKIAVNRNGHYRAFVAKAENTLELKIDIIKI